jgi:hypothetical protein
MRNHFQATGPVDMGMYKTPGVYPVVPATWPNRAVRRAVRYRRELPREWAAFFFANPKLKELVRTGRLAT